jgi:hypothetical protein
MRTKLLALLVGVAMLEGISAFVAPSSAQASATICANGTCVDVKGTSTFVNSVNCGVVAGPRKTVRGPCVVWGSGFRSVSTINYHNNSWFFSRRVWAPTKVINRNLPHGSQVCAQFNNAAVTCAKIYR